MKTAIALAAALGLAPPAAERVDTGFYQWEQGQALEIQCTAPLGCVATTNELLAAMLAQAHRQGRQACRPSI